MKEEGISKPIKAAVIVVIVVVAVVGAYFILKGPEEGVQPGGEDGEEGEGPGSPPLYEGATYTETREILSVQGSAYTVPAHSAEVYDYYLGQMPSLGWTEVSRRVGILYFEKGDYGAAIKATEDVGPQTQLVIGYALKAEFEPIEEENVLLPTNYQTTFPSPTDVFLPDFTDYYFKSLYDPEILSQTHATIVGTIHQVQAPQREDYYSHIETTRHIMTIADNAGLRYTSWLSSNELFGSGNSPIKNPDYPGVYQWKPEFLEATCIDIDGKKFFWHTDGFYCQCTNNPIWRDFLLETAKRSIDYGAYSIGIDAWIGTFQTLTLRDYCRPERGFYNGCFCEHCMEGFRGYLKGKYTTEELEGFGIENIDNFDYGDFIRERYLTTYQDGDRRRREVPLFSDFEDYQMVSFGEFARELISETRAYARAHGKDVYFTANTATLLPQYLAMQDELDYLSPEVRYCHAIRDSLFKYPGPPYTNVPAFKLVRSLGKPLVVTQPGEGFEELVAMPDMMSLMKIYTAEAYSARGFYYVPYNSPLYPPGQGWAYGPRDMSELKPYYDFIFNNEQYYDNLFSTSRIAVLYSYPSARHEQSNFYGISNLLLDSHFQYDVLFAGDNNWTEDNLSLGQLNEYEVVILPSTECLSDRQVDLLLSYVESGGNIVAFGCIGLYDEKDREVERGLLESLLVEGINDYGLGQFIFISSKVGAEYSGTRDTSTREEFAEILKNFSQPNIETNASENVVFLEYWNDKTRSTVIHLINYAYDIETEHLSPQENINLKIMLNPELIGKNLSISYISPDLENSEERRYTLPGGSVEFQVPHLEFYGVVSVEETSD